jgi:hypothetical protein
VLQRGCRDLRVDHGAWPALAVGFAHEITPDRGGALIESQNPPLELPSQIDIEPLPQSAPATPGGEFGDATRELPERNGGEIEIGCRLTSDPIECALRGPGSYEFTDEIGVYKIRWHFSKVEVATWRLVALEIQLKPDQRRGAKEGDEIAAGLRHSRRQKIVEAMPRICRLLAARTQHRRKPADRFCVLGRHHHLDAPGSRNR